MNKPYLVTVCEKRYFDLEILASDDQVIFDFQDPEKARFIYGSSHDKLNHPDRYRSPHKKEIEVIEVIEGVEP